MGKSREHFEQLSIEEIREEIHKGELSALELAFARTVIKNKEKEPVDISDESLEEKITQIIEFGDHKQKRDLCKWIGDNDDYSQLTNDIKRKIISINIVVSDPQKESQSPSIEEIPQNVPPKKEKPSTKKDLSIKEGESKSDQIRSLFDKGETAASIAKQLNAHYSFVWGVIKKHKNQ